MALRNVGIDPAEYVTDVGLPPISCSIGVQHPEFEPLEHSVYLGRERLGRYSRIGPKLYAAFDAKDRLLGKFKRRKDAYAAVSLSAQIRRTPSAKRARR